MEVMIFSMTHLQASLNSHACGTTTTKPFDQRHADPEKMRVPGLICHNLLKDKSLISLVYQTIWTHALSGAGSGLNVSTERHTAEIREKDERISSSQREAIF